MSADIIDVFEAPATPQFRQARPDIIRARMAWASRRMAAARLEGLERVLTHHGLSVGDRVCVQVGERQWLAGRITEWRREGGSALLPGPMVAAVRLDPYPPHRFPQLSGPVVTVRRNQLHHLQPGAILA